jgi:translation initiation factor IF-3
LSKQKQVLKNEDIKAKEVRCNTEEGTIGIISTQEALERAREEGLDLVLIAPNANPPVAKIMDYGKFKYQEEKRKKEQKKNQNKIDLKEIKFSIKIAENDINFKIKQIKQFLKKNKHVKLTVMLKGREIANPELAKQVLEKIFNQIKDDVKIEKQAKLEGRNYTMIVSSAI